MLRGQGLGPLAHRHVRVRARAKARSKARSKARVMFRAWSDLGPGLAISGDRSSPHLARGVWGRGIWGPGPAEAVGWTQPVAIPLIDCSAGRSPLVEPPYKA